MIETAAGAARRNTLEKWSSTAFLSGGFLWIVFVAYNGLKVLNVVASPPTLVNDLLLLCGFIAAFVGLSGLYLHTVDSAPRLAKAGAVFVAIGAISFTADRSAALVVSFVADIPYDQVVTGLEPLYMVTYFSALIAFILFSAASFRAHRLSHTVGSLLLVPPVMFLTYLVGSAAVSNPDFVLLVWGIIAVAWLALGYRLRAEATPIDRVEPAPPDAP